jgi:hypothetical protein
MTVLPHDERTESFCTLCRQILPIEHFSRVQKHYTHKNCNACRAKEGREARKLREPAKANPLAYTHIIRDRYSGTAYKTTLFDSPVPKGYVIVYTAQRGFLLPRRYEDLEVYDENIRP